MLYGSLKGLIESLKDTLKISDHDVEVLNKEKIVSTVIDDLVYNAALNEDDNIKSASRWIIKCIADEFNIILSSIQELYEARSRDEYKDVTVPAVNIRGLTYDLARALTRTAIKNNSQTFIFEIAKSEIVYTLQRPAEYTAVILAACIKENYEGPVFIQADHVQVSSKNFNQDKNAEIKNLKLLIGEEIEAGFYNIDIDSSTLVDLNKEDVEEQQRLNFEVAAELTSYIRDKQPEGIIVSIGGEIGEVGKKNSTAQELRAFMDGYLEILKAQGNHQKGISKISVQTGTSHGGVVLPDGSVAEASVDFEMLKNLSKIAQEEYHLAGAVQHGASTLPREAFDKFPQVQTAEIHLATGFQNAVYESSHLPEELRKKMYDYIKTELKDEKKEHQTEDQFIYKMRKKAFGPFKKELMDLPVDTRYAISKEVEDMFDFMFKKLNAVNTERLIDKFIKLKKIPVEIPPELRKAI